MKIGASLTRPREIRSADRPPQQVYPTIPGFTPRAEDAFAHLLRGIAPERLVLGAGLCSVIIYLGFVLAFPITRWWNHPHVPSNPNVINDMGRITGYSPLAAVAFVGAILALFACQFFALTATAGVKQMGAPRTRMEAFVRYAVFLGPLVFGSIMVWMQPVTTTDLYGYVARGYLYTHLHLNPMTHGAQLLPGGLAVDRPASPYGPIWLIVTALVSSVSGENLLLNMLIYKLIGLATVGVALWLVDLLARSLYPERRLRIYVLFGWSPLLIFESVGNAHNDILMVVCVLGAFALMLRDYARGAFALLVLGALIKYVSAIFLPLWLVYELRHLIPHTTPARIVQTGGQGASTRLTIRGSRGIVTASHALVREWVRSAASAARKADRRAIGWLLAQSAAIGIILVIVAYAPFWDGINTFTGLAQQIRPRYYNSSLVGFFSGPVQAFMSPGSYEAFDKTVRLVVYVIFGIYTYIQIRWLWQRGADASIRDVITGAAKITCAALLLITFWFQPWYVIWLVPLAALAAEPYVRRQGAILAVGGLLTYAVGNFLFVNESDLAHDLFVQFFEILVAFGPLLLLRAAPYDQGWTAILRRYVGLFGEGLNRRPIFWERVMLVLIAIVAALLRLVRLGPLFSQATSNSETNILKQASDDLKLFLADPQGLNGPFVALQGFLLDIFGRNAFAVLLPSAVIGSLTVIAIYILTYQMMRQGNLPGKGTVALLAALLAATSHWHVSLSRSGMQVVMLPLLMCLAIYWLLLALRMGAVMLASKSGAATPPSTVNAQTTRKGPNGKRRTRKRQPASATTTQTVRLADGNGVASFRRRHLFYYIGCGICTGLACDLAPGLWLVPLLVAGMLVVWRWLRPKGLHVSRTGLIALIATALVTGIPVIWHYVSGYIGFPKGSPFLAKGTTVVVTVPALVSPAFWGQVAHNAGDVLGLLISQDYSAGYPSVGGAPIIPPLFQAFFVVGLLVIIVRWRSFGSLALLLLVALPLVASVAVGTPAGVIEAAGVLPALCIVPAVGLYQSGRWLSHLPIVLDRINGVRIFSTPEQIGRVLLLMFLVFSTIRTFFWYFEATLPQRQKDFSPSWNGSHVVYVQPHDVAGAARAEQLASSPDGWQLRLVPPTPS